MGTRASPAQNAARKFLLIGNNVIPAAELQVVKRGGPQLCGRERGEAAPPDASLASGERGAAFTLGAAAYTRPFTYHPP